MTSRDPTEDPLHRLLRRQLHRHLGEEPLNETSFRSLLADIDLAYRQADDEREMLERAMAIVSEEMLERYDRERRRGETQERLNEALRGISHALATDSGDPYYQAALVSEQVATALAADLVAIWRVDGKRGALHSLDRFDRRAQTHAATNERIVPGGAEALSRLIGDAPLTARCERGPHTLHELLTSCPPGTSSVMYVSRTRVGAEVTGLVVYEFVADARSLDPAELTFTGSVSDLVAIGIESQRRRAAEQALDEQRRFLREVLDLIPNHVFAKDRQGLFVLVNRAFAEAHGAALEGLVGRSDAEINNSFDAIAEMRRHDLQVFDSGTELLVPEEAFTDATGRKRFVETMRRPLFGQNGEVRTVLGVATDITERKRVEEERVRLEASLRQDQKLKAIGMLAGGVAHDFNNLLTPILAGIGSLREKLASDAFVTEELADIQVAAAQARELTRQLLAFGRQQVLDLRNIDLNEEINNAMRLSARILPPTIRCESQLSSDLPLVRADRVQLQQVMANLVLNARDAMRGEGTIVLTTRRAPDGRVAFAVRDNGIGMDEATRARVFEPFFSTKEPGRGIGLGLSTVYGIVQQHGGQIVVTSEPGRGATFEVFLPAAAVERTRPDPTPIPTLSARTALVVDDEPLVLRTVLRLVTSLGYTVLTARDGEEALAVASTIDGKIDVVITDVSMPRMTGPELFYKLRTERPDTAFLFMSGYSKELREGVFPASSVFLAKPFSVDELREKIRLALDHAPREGNV